MYKRQDKNNVRGEVVKISTDDSSIDVYVIPTDEELMIARDTLHLRLLTRWQELLDWDIQVDLK